MLEEQENKTLLCLTALCLCKTEWATRLLRALGSTLRVPDSSVEGAVCLLYDSQECETDMLERAEAVSASLRSAISRETAIQGFVTLFLLVLRGQDFAALAVQNDKKHMNEIQERYQVLHYNARSSVLFRRLAFVLRIKLSALALLEELAIRDIQKESLLIQEKQQESAAEKKKNAWMRGAKIGAAATAAGGLLFVTGGMAAPAISVVLSSMGMAGLSAWATTTTCAALLGGAGVHLGAYKMYRRTEGLKSFDFHKIDASDTEEELEGMTVYICMSGYIRQAGENKEGSSETLPALDFFGPWGAQPAEMTNAQILDRFYQIVDPSKRSIVPKLLSKYKNSEDELMDKLETAYNLHPRKIKPETSYPQFYLNGEDATTCKRFLLEIGSHLKSSIATAKKEGIANDKVQTSSAVSQLFSDPTQPWDSYLELPTLEDKVESADEQKLRSKEEVEAVLQRLESSLKVDEDNEECSNGPLEDEIKVLEVSEQSDSNDLAISTDRVPPKENETYWWRESIAAYGDQYTVVWDPDKLLPIGQCVTNLIKEGVKLGVNKSLAYTAFGAALSAIALPMSVANVFQSLDEGWTVASEAADEAGLNLADALMRGIHGDRPVVLIGYSVAGRIIASCLTELARIAHGAQDKSGKSSDGDEHKFLTDKIENDPSLSSEERKRRLRAATIIRDAVIIGAPCHSNAAKWALRRSVVVGRLINVYSPSDWVLNLLYRYKRWSVVPLAGLQAIELGTEQKSCETIENFDVSDIVFSHGDYANKMREILARISIGDVECEDHLPKYFVSNQYSLE